MASSRWRWGLRLACVGLGLLLFVLALELLKQGASGLGPLLRRLGVEGFSGGLGFGWLMACVVLSGSPVAALALTLLAAGTLTTAETFGVIAGSRLGASFVVLVIGGLDDLRAGRRDGRSAYLGVAALVTTAIVYLPAMALAWLGLTQGVFVGLRIEGHELAGLVEALFGPLLRFGQAHLPRLASFVAGMATLLLAFKLFDRALPDLQGREAPLLETGSVFYRPWFMFAVGLAFTAVTLSVSVSLALLVPLAAKGYVRRENVCPYIMGANVTTFIDTLFAGALVGHPDGVRIVALLMTTVTACSLPVVLLFPYAFGQLVDRLARQATGSPRRLIAFVLGLLLVPLSLIVIF